LELGLSCQQLEQNIPALFTDPAYGHVLRAKGFVQDENGWVELNATADGLTANAIPQGAGSAHRDRGGAGERTD